MIGTPRPRNDSVASSAMARATCTVATTISGGRQFGSRWRKMMRRRRQREAFGGLDVFLRRSDQRRGAHRARVVRPLDDDQREHDVHHALAQHGEDHQRDQDRRERELQVDEAHDGGIGAAADIGGDQAERGADDAGDERGADTDAEGDAQAVEDAGEHVAALVVGAERVGVAGGRCGTRRQAAVHDVELREVVGVLRRDQRGEDRREADQDEDNQRRRARRATRRIRRRSGGTGFPRGRRVAPDRLPRGGGGPFRMAGAMPTLILSPPAARADRAACTADRPPG